MAIKPTVTEYDLVYGALRAYSRHNFDLLREWILEGGNPGGGSIVSITYADLIIDLTGGTLVAGQFYEISDFQQVQDIPNTADTNIGPVEPLLILATSTTSLGEDVLSLTFPQDEIRYEVQNVEFGATMGRITSRIDTLRDNQAPFDFRTYQFRRWEDAAGDLVATSDNGNPFQDFPTFDDTLANNFKIEPFPGVLVNNVAYGIQNEITLRFGATLNTIFDQGLVIELGEVATSNVLFINTTNITLGAGSAGNVIGGGCARITAGTDLTGSTILDGCLDVVIGNVCASLDLAGTSRDISIGNRCNNISWVSQVTGFNCLDDNTFIVMAGGGQNMKLGHTNSSCDFGDIFLNIEMGNANFFLSILSDNMLNVKFGNLNFFLDMSNGACNDVTFGNNNDSAIIHAGGNITIAHDSLNLEIQPSNNIVVGSNANACSIGDGCNNIYIGDDCAACGIGDGCEDIIFNSGISSRNTNSNEQNREDWVNKSTMTLLYSFAQQGGAIGTIQLATIGGDAYIINAVLKATNTLTTGAGDANIAIGPATDDPDGIIDIANSDAIFNGDLNLALPQFADDTSYTDITAAQRFIQMVITNNALTAGRFYVTLDVQYDV